MAGFEVYGATRTGGGDDLREKFEAMNKHVVETCGLDKPKTLIGIVSGIADLGSQPLPDGEYALQGEDLNLSIEELKVKYAEDMENKGVYFADGYNGVTKQKELMKKVPRDPFQCVALSIDFPTKMVNKGQFFGDDTATENPLRVWYGGKFWDGENMVIQNLTPLKVTKIDDSDKEWSLNPKSILHKMAVASELVEDVKTPFPPSRIDELLGKAFLFSVQVTFEAGKGKNADKRYYKEKVTFTGALMDGQEAPAIPKTNLIMMKSTENNADAVKEIPAHIRNTMARAKEFEGSALQQAIVALSNHDNDTPTREVDAVQKVETETKVVANQSW